MSELNEEILQFLDKNSSFDSLEYAEKSKIDHQKIVGAIKSLQINEGVCLKFTFYFCSGSYLVKKIIY